ncbi:MAG: hypothetical protein K8963_11550 [Proteobacteria bacterium]|nr:hypothetical protein [Pseudomonadota bacterium]
MNKTPKTSQPDTTEPVRGHQPVLHTLGLVYLLNQIGLAQSRYGLNMLRAQMLVLIWRFPQIDLESVCQQYYLDSRVVSKALTQLRRQGYISDSDKSKGNGKGKGKNKDGRSVRGLLLQRRWTLSERAHHIVPDLLRAEEKLHRALSEHGSSFSAHWCYNMQNLNSALQRQCQGSGKDGESGDGESGDDGIGGSDS